MYAYIFKTTQWILMRVILVERELEEEGLYVYTVTFN
jgi:hypothetical protein